MFGPPEVITGRLMSGAGAGPMLAASAEFTAATAAYEAAADRLTAQLAYLSANWQGTTAMALQRTIIRFLAWMRVLQSQLALSATRTADQATAFSTAYASMAQMVEITENRVTTAVLHATNFLGVNTIPIGVREGQYAEMWAQDVAVQTGYWAATVANTTFEPFVPAPPISGFTSFPPVINQAVNAAAAAADKVRLAADEAMNQASLLKGRLGLTLATGVDAGLQAKAAGQQAEAQAAVARLRESDAQREAERPKEQQMTQQMAQQLMQQAPQQAAQIGQQLAQLPQQAMQQVGQMQQQVTQFGSQIGQLMSQVAPEHRLDNPGFFDTHPSSTTLDRLAGGGGSAPMTAMVRVPNLSGLSGLNTGFRFPAGWEGAITPPAPPSSAGSGAAGPGGAAGRGGAMVRPRRRREDDEDTTIKRETELKPLWGYEPEEPESVSVGEFAGEKSPARDAP